MNTEGARCDLCGRYFTYLIPKESNKRGYEGNKMVCRVCYERLKEYDSKINIQSKGGNT